MRTLEEIRSFIVDNKTGYLEANTAKDAGKGKYDKSISYLLSNLRDDEDVKFALYTTGIKNGAGVVQAGGTVILMITNQRIIYGSKDFLSEEMKSISFDECHDVQSSTFGIFCGSISIHTKTEKLRFDLDKKHVARIAAEIDKLIRELVKETKKEATTVIQQASGADELLKYKQLLDAGIISQEEFEAKKKQILGL
jgi:hypothetical protein